VSQLEDSEFIEWDCVHIAENQDHDEDDESDNESMEDLSSEVLSRSISHDTGAQEHDDNEDDDEEKEGDESEEDNKENNSCIQLYFQSKGCNLDYNITLLLLESIIDENCFD
jgi:hypothetical protein